ncbi:MAG TPA: hypothetical protein PK156_01260 [Polyangium sp.]|nr:hypothetical protein [Polyangium sp.]
MKLRLKRIVVALTNIRWIALVFAMMILGCGSSAIELQSPESGAFAQLLRNEITSDARRSAHGMAAFVRGNEQEPGMLDPAKLPEAYTPNGEEANRRYQFHLGYAAQRLLRAYYAAAFPASVPERDQLVEIVNAAGGDTGKIDAYDRDRHVDIADIAKRFVFEIVPPGQAHEIAGKKKVDEQLSLLNKAMVDVPKFQLGAGFDGEIGVRFGERTVPWKLVWSTNNGVVRYQWMALTVDRFTDDACLVAYLDNRWHIPSLEEMVRNARPLHEVVERLVQAREAQGQTRAATMMPMLPGKTVAEYRRSVALWGGQDERIARLLPIMAEPPPPPPPPQRQVRRDPRLLAQTGPGPVTPKMYPGATTPDGFVVPPHPSAPEGYTLDGRYGNMPWQFFLGYSAHRAIAYNYWVHHPLGLVYRNFFSVATIVRDSGGNKDLLPWSDADLRPDITHVMKDDQFVYEIKPRGDVHLAKGKEKLAQYIAALNRGVAGTPMVFVPGPDYKGALAIRFKGGTRCWYLEWYTGAPGVLQYTLHKLNPVVDDDGIIAMNDCEKALLEGKWTDLSEKEMKDDARAFFDYVEMTSRYRDRIGQVRDGSTMPIEAIGTLAELILSAALLLQMDTTLAVVETVPKGVPVSPPPPPKPVPPVNARSLGSDTRIVPRTPRPVTPGKTPKTVSPN